MVVRKLNMNNSKEIIRGYKERFRRLPSERLANKIELLTQGGIADHLDKDGGNEPRNKIIKRFKTPYMEINYKNWDKQIY